MVGAREVTFWEVGIETEGSRMAGWRLERVSVWEEPSLEAQ